MTTKAFRVLGFIRRHSFNFSLTNCILALYYALVRSVIEYGSVVWSPYTAVDICRIYHVQNSFMRFASHCLSIPYLLRDYGPISQALRLDSLSVKRDKFSISFIKDLIEDRVDAPRLLGELSIRIPSNTKLQSNFYLPTKKSNFSRNCLLKTEPAATITEADTVSEGSIITDHIKPSPPVFMKRVLDFPGFSSVLIELIGVDNFYCKSSTDRLKIQTANPESYRSLIRYLKDQKSEYHTFQLRENKPLSKVIRNLHPSTHTELIKSELETRLYEYLVDQEITLNIKLKTHDIDNAVDKFTSIIQSAAWASQSKSPTFNSIPLLLIHIRSLITNKRRVRARYQTSRLPYHKALYNKLSNSLKKQLLKYKSDIFKQKLSNFSSSDGSLWRETNKLLQYKSSSPPLTKIDNSIAISNEDKAETFRQ
ncbi:hypothetical protein QTP88_015580 [Uroleucon formosanum]